MTPYPEAEAQRDPQKTRYNKAHSNTRRVVECSFGRLKNRFRVLLGKVELKTNEHRCQLILACVVLHNLLFQVKDSVAVDGIDPALSHVPIVVDDDPSDPELPISHLQGIAKRDDIAAIIAGRLGQQN